MAQRKFYEMRGPFKGELPDHSARIVPPMYATEALNVYTRFGAVSQRPGYAGFRTGVPARIPYLKHVVVGGDPYLYAYQNGGLHRFIDASGSEGYAGSISPITAAPTASDAIPQVVTDNDSIVYIVQGTMGSSGASRKVFIDSGAWKSQRLGITAPTVNATVAAGAAGGLIGNYDYRYTWYNSLTGTESGPSPITGATTTVSTIDITLTGTQSSDTQVTHWRLYRRKNALPGQADKDATWFFLTNVAMVAGVVVYNDNTADSVIVKSRDTQIPLADALPPTSEIACFHKGRMFYAPAGSVIYCSEPEKPEQVDGENNFAIGSGEGDTIVGMVSAGDVLWIFKSLSVWYMTGDDPDTSYTFHRLETGIGCMFRDSLVDIGGDIYFVSHRGPMVLSAGQLKFIGAPIEITWRANVPFALQEYFELQAAWEPLTNSYIVCTPAGTSTNPATNTYNKQFAYQIDSDSWVQWGIAQARGIAQHNTLTAAPYCYMTVPGTITPGPPPVQNYDVISLGTLATDNGSTITFSWTTGRLDFGTHERKTIRSVHVLFDSTDSGNIELFYKCDNDSSFTSAGTVAANSNPGQRWFNVNLSNVTYAQFKITGTKNVPTSILGLAVDVEVSDHR